MAAKKVATQIQTLATVTATMTRHPTASVIVVLGTRMGEMEDAAEFEGIRAL